MHVIGTSGALRTATVVFYLSNEGISLIENATRLGLPVPDHIRRALDLITRDVTGKPDLEHHPSQTTPAEKENP
ncbi:phage holin family protein [Corynebacterium striatum]|uniref:phage holin family protein n=1 Tax=Corynebacterium striatum TaxID=43770 RepID=UPI00209C116B|nr:phage holin family protein [Corynebacterium striatum]